MVHTEAGPLTSKALSKTNTLDQRLQVIILKSLHNKLLNLFKVKIKALYAAGLKQKEISIQLGFTPRQVGFAIAANDVSPKKAKGRKSILLFEQVDGIETFVCLPFNNRRKSS